MRVSCRELMPLIEAEVLAHGGRARFTVEGASMFPLLLNGDVVELEAYGARPLRVGDVVLAKDATDYFVLHRVARVKGEQCYLLGDAQITLTGPFTREQVIGRVTAAWRHGRRLPTLGPGWRLWGPVWCALPRWRNAAIEGLRRCRHALRRPFQSRRYSSPRL